MSMSIIETLKYIQQTRFTKKCHHWIHQRILTLTRVLPWTGLMEDNLSVTHVFVNTLWNDLKD